MTILKFISSLILLSLLALIVLNSSGCAWMFLPQGDNISREQTKTFRVTVTSTPSNADIYLDSKLVGRTPFKKLPIKVYYKMSMSRMLYAATPWHIHHIERHSLIVEKEGYKNSRIDLTFKDLGGGKLGLMQKKYHFELEKEEILHPSKIIPQKEEQR